jgi:hypothetical protein
VAAAQRYPNIAQLKHIGTSREGRKLLGLKVMLNIHYFNYLIFQIGTSSPEGKTKPGVWIDGGNHAREWPAFHLCIYFIDKVRLLTWTSIL